MNYREMHQLAQNPVAIRGLACRLLAAFQNADLSDRAREFLASMQKYDGSTPLNTRALEALYGLRERSTRRSRVGEYSADRLAELVYNDRALLSHYEDEEWICQLHERSPGLALSNSEWKRLFARARELDLIDEWVQL